MSFVAREITVGGYAHRTEVSLGGKIFGSTAPIVPSFLISDDWKLLNASQIVPCHNGYLVELEFENVG